MSRSASTSSRQVTGAGPRNCFILTGRSDAGSCTADQVLGVDISATRIAQGTYTVTHNMGKTGYCGIFTIQDNTATGAGNVLTARIHGRSGNTCDIFVEDDGGALTDPDFIHGVFYD